jgi:type IV pilus assembly protein PilC
MIVTPGQLARRAELYHQLGSMISAGIPLIQALEMARSSPGLHSSEKTITGIIHNLQAGMTFSDSITKVAGWLPEFDTALLSVGEEAGRLDACFRQLSVYYATRASIIRDTISGLAITAATFHVFLLVFPLGLLIAFAQGIAYNDYRQCIPFLLEKLLAFGSLYGGVFLLIFAGQGRRGEPWRAAVEAVMQLIPVLRTAQKNLALSRLAGAMEALTNAGVSVIRSWELAAAASGSPRLGRIISGWKTALEGGVTPAELINQSSYFPEMFANLFQTAEVSGKVDEALHRLQVYYQEEGFRRLRVFTRLMNGTIYGLLVLLVAFNVFRFYMNYYGSMFNGF